MTGTVLERRRTTLDLVLGILLVLAGLLLLSNVVFATVVSVRLLGWTTLGAGAVLLVRVLLYLRSGASWSTAVGGVVLTVVGLFILRNPVVGAVSLTLVVGALLLATGLTRMFPGPAGAAGPGPDGRGVQLLSGLVSVVLGLWVLLNVTTASLPLLGVLVAVQVLLEGATLAVAGRLRPVPAGTTTARERSADPRRPG